MHATFQDAYVTCAHIRRQMHDIYRLGPKVVDTGLFPPLVNFSNT